MAPVCAPTLEKPSPWHQFTHLLNKWYLNVSRNVNPKFIDIVFTSFLYICRHCFSLFHSYTRPPHGMQHHHRFICHQRNVQHEQNCSYPNCCFEHVCYFDSVHMIRKQVMSTIKQYFVLPAWTTTNSLQYPSNQNHCSLETVGFLRYYLLSTL